MTREKHATHLHCHPHHPRAGQGKRQAVELLRLQDVPEERLRRDTCSTATISSSSSSIIIIIIIITIITSDSRFRIRFIRVIFIDSVTGCEADVEVHAHTRVTSQAVAGGEAVHRIMQQCCRR